MKKIILFTFLLACLSFSPVFSQDFLGISTGNYSGITGVMLQPASIVDSRFKFDINLISSSVNYSNNYFLVDRNAILKFNKNNFGKYSTFKDKYLSKGTLEAGEKAFFNIDNRVQLPLSFMATTGKKSAIALNLQFRTKIQGRGISEDLANLAFDNFNPQLINNPIDASGISVNTLSWAEAGLTYGRVLLSSDKHFLKGAFTGKYLAGVSSFNVSSNDLQLQVNVDSSFNFNSSAVSYNHNKNADFDKLFQKNFNPNAESFGFDAGLVYEYRGNLNSKYLKNDDEVSYMADRRDLNKYVIKAGVSILDVGMFQFNKPQNVNSFSANINNWDIKNGNYGSLRNFDSALANRVIADPNDAGSYNVYLPTAVSAQVDLRFVKGLFLNVMSYWPVEIGSEEGKRFNNYGFYTITPRYERRRFGVYFPYTVSQRNDFTDYKQNVLGATVRLGPFYVGSSNLGTMLFNKDLKAADVHLGFKVGITYGKPDKSTKLFDKIFSGNDVDIYRYDTAKYVVQNAKAISNKINDEDKNAEKGKILMNNNRGNIYNNPDAKGNIIIINNYYNNDPLNKANSTAMYNDSAYRQLLRDNNLENLYAQNKLIESQRMELRIDSSNKVITDSLMRVKLRNDSISKVTTDSLRAKKVQLDSLIKSMQQLRMEMDSSIEEQSFGYTTEKYNLVSAEENQQALNATLNKAQTNSEDVKTSKRINDSAIVYSLQNDTLKIKNDLSSKSENINIEKKRANDLSSVKKKKSENDKSLVVVAQPREKYSPPANFATEKTQRDIQQRQAEQYSAYMNQASRLQNEIKSLDRQLALAKENNLSNANNVRYYPVENTKTNFVPVYPSNNQPAYISQNVIKADTVFMRDTVFLRDTITNRITDTIQKIMVKEAKPFIQEKEVAVENPLNYTALPAEIILFALGKASIQQIYNARLNYIAKILEGNKELLVAITGHTDATGSKAINEKLSLQRAEAVAEYFKKKGIIENQLVIKSYSFDDPAVLGSTKNAQSQNRRVEVKLISK